MNKKPIELHVIDGTRPNHNKREKGSPALLPDVLRQRIPAADWMDNPFAWDKQKFIDTVSEFLFEAYGIGTLVDSTALTMLANYVEVYIKAMEGLANTGVVTKFNGGKTVGVSPYLTAADRASQRAIQLMNELGITPRSRLNSTGIQDNSDAARFMRGPKG